MSGLKRNRLAVPLSRAYGVEEGGERGVGGGDGVGGQREGEGDGEKASSVPKGI